MKVLLLAELGAPPPGLTIDAADSSDTLPRLPIAPPTYRIDASLPSLLMPEAVHAYAHAALVRAEQPLERVLFKQACLDHLIARLMAVHDAAEYARVQDDFVEWAEHVVLEWLALPDVPHAHALCLSANAPPPPLGADGLPTDPIPAAISSLLRSLLPGRAVRAAVDELRVVRWRGRALAPAAVAAAPVVAAAAPVAAAPADGAPAAPVAVPAAPPAPVAAAAAGDAPVMVDVPIVLTAADEVLLAPIRLRIEEAKRARAARTEQSKGLSLEDMHRHTELAKARTPIADQCLRACAWVWACAQWTKRRHVRPDAITMRLAAPLMTVPAFGTTKIVETKRDGVLGRVLEFVRPGTHTDGLMHVIDTHVTALVAIESAPANSPAPPLPPLPPSPQQIRAALVRYSMPDSADVIVVNHPRPLPAACAPRSPVGV